MDKTEVLVKEQQSHEPILVEISAQEAQEIEQRLEQLLQQPNWVHRQESIASFAVIK